MVMMTAERVVPSAIGKRIKDARERAGWSQATLARQSGQDRAWISLVELGEIKNPGLHKVERIAQALGVDPRVLTHGAVEGVPIQVAAEDLPDFEGFLRLPRWARRAGLRVAESLMEDRPDDEPNGNPNRKD